MAVFLSIGTGPGIGLATAERFAEEGFDTVLASRTPSRLAIYAEAIRKGGHACESRPVDVADAQSVSSLVAGVLDHHGAIDVLHYNAASLRRAGIADQPADSFVADLSVNIAGAMVAIQAVSPSMFARSRGTILITGGQFGQKPRPDYISLSVGKSGLRTLVLGLFETFKAKGVHIAIANVAGPIDPASDLPAGVADCLWRLHSAPRDAWVAEAPYP
ncbi:SDR family NAD(P)-dependent oxidoreductase [Ancylobacter sp. WKF20]|uniref:SDR family NAD(P)-dependent oxidoreductase n=1 Tax=Ancylobacter sp. WKF20 TaxID=3039801 RepID=UPI0024340FBD|nr:SDR family NAD(P)-dependent oxidoreductase [Ancylobacter sp. WKF20]WGD32235.1 SDR family NAD(P)-dependent oxidoreductase [Ancylobacter sp. WKF20]